MINTKSVKGRRSLRFEQLADILSDATSDPKEKASLMIFPT